MPLETEKQSHSLSSTVGRSLTSTTRTSNHTLTTESHHSATSGLYNSCLSSNAQQQQERLHPLTDLIEEKKLSHTVTVRCEMAIHSLQYGCRVHVTGRQQVLPFILYVTTQRLSFPTLPSADSLDKLVCLSPANKNTKLMFKLNLK